MSTFVSENEQRRRSATKYTHRRRTDLIVKRRARYGSHFKCELCEEVVDVIETAHVCGKGGRRSGVPEKWASTPQLCTALCCTESYGMTHLGCHELADRNIDPDIKCAMEVQAARRLVSRISAIPAVDWELLTTAEYDPQDIAREMIRVAEAEGLEP